MSVTRKPAEADFSNRVDCSPDLVRSEIVGQSPGVEAGDAITLACEDCDVVLTADNTHVSYEAAFWLGVDWTSEQFCSVCKDRREADGPPDSAISYDPPDTTWYREQLRQAGRGHLLG